MQIIGQWTGGGGGMGTLPSPPGDQDPDSPVAAAPSVLHFCPESTEQPCGEACGAHALVSLRPMAKRHTQTMAQTSPSVDPRPRQAPPLLPATQQALNQPGPQFPSCKWTHGNAWFEFLCEKCNTMPGNRASAIEGWTDK